MNEECRDCEVMPSPHCPCNGPSVADIEAEERFKQEWLDIWCSDVLEKCPGADRRQLEKLYALNLRREQAVAVLKMYKEFL